MVILLKKKKLHRIELYIKIHKNFTEMSCILKILLSKAVKYFTTLLIIQYTKWIHNCTQLVGETGPRTPEENFTFRTTTKIFLFLKLS